MPSFVKFSAGVAVGVGVAAVGWFAWKAYVKARAPVMQLGDSDEAQADAVPAEDNIVPPVDVEKPDPVPEVPAAKVKKGRKPNKHLWNKCYQRRLAKRAQEKAERLAQQAAACADAPVECELPLAAVPADDEEAPAPTVEQASEEPSVVPVQHESVVEAAPAECEQLVEVVAEEVAAVAAVDVAADVVADAVVAPAGPVRAKPRNKSYQRRLEKRAKERAERLAQQQGGE
ncbi:hypothetical protein GHT06_017503 [Daphnia sinensis]|uniref:Uncharacterized protein n=1 Tax=Daphnia sinensis TaxID=1820382 RepID=A0AAD5KPZ0_9CRUS|nr:hypothetical protein GHT06_017503 [Daphnia sinensis]